MSIIDDLDDLDPPTLTHCICCRRKLRAGSTETVSGHPLGAVTTWLGHRAWCWRNRLDGPTTNAHVLRTLRRAS